MFDNENNNEEQNGFQNVNDTNINSSEEKNNIPENSMSEEEAAKEHFEKSVENMSQAAQDAAEKNAEKGYSYYNMKSFEEQASKNEEANNNTKKQKKPKQKKPMTTGRKWGTAVAMAAVVGVVAGSVFYGVNAAGNAFIYNTNKTTAQIAQTDTVASSDSSTGTGSTTSSTSSSNSTVADVAKECMPSLVTISTLSVQEMQSFFGGNQEYEVQGAGTGVIVGENDTELLIATNNHVVNGAQSLSVGFTDESSVEAQIKGTDSDNDLAIVSVKLSDISDDTMSQIKIATIGDSDELSLGDQVVAIGNALGYGQSVTSGIISAFNRNLELSDGTNTFESTGLIQTDAAINSGNSGGALLNMKGELIGINEAKSSSTSSSGASVEGVGYAIPISKALPILQNLMTLTTREKVDSSEAGYLGITCADVTSDISNSYNMPEGVCVTSVIEGGAAEAAGIQKGDVITKIDGHEVSTYDDIKEQLQYYAQGQTIDITIERADAGEYVEQDISVTLTSYDVLQNYYDSVQNGNGSNNSQNK